jgi:type IV pilus assembly protein PilN
MLQMYVFLALFGGGALFLCGFGWFWKQAQIRDLDAKIVVAQKRQAELQVIKRQVDALEAKRQMLKQKNDLIERLRKEQSYPVHMLDEVSKALPNVVWLTSLRQSPGGVALSGKSNGLNAVADFITNLQNSGWFPQVDLGGTAAGADGVVDFTLNTAFRDPTLAVPPPGTAVQR